ncbi:hypothetical protein [Flavobacterium sp. UBA4197]|uniref:hypothetical protein n=1 Tax=Flavobacterium sp. UBA4197 TaxID=1946546 RepID=UPI00257FABB5|nr:hypothetical protein [Flavobacterium sp. UBA4197]
MKAFEYYSPIYIAERLDTLFTALQYDTLENELTVCERILINQERGSLFDSQNFFTGELDQKDVRRLQVPEELNKKIVAIIKNIELGS